MSARSAAADYLPQADPARSRSETRWAAANHREALRSEQYAMPFGGTALQRFVERNRYPKIGLLRNRTADLSPAPEGQAFDNRGPLYHNSPKKHRKKFFSTIMPSCKAVILYPTKFIVSIQ